MKIGDTVEIQTKSKLYEVRITAIDETGIRGYYSEESVNHGKPTEGLWNWDSIYQTNIVYVPEKFDNGQMLRSNETGKHWMKFKDEWWEKTEYTDVTFNQDLLSGHVVKTIEPPPTFATGGVITGTINIRDGKAYIQGGNLK